MRTVTKQFKAQLSGNIILQYNDLLAGKNLQDAIEKAYGPQGTFTFT